MSKEFESILSNNKIYHQQNNPETQEKQDPFAQSDINLNAQIIRIQTLACTKQIQKIFSFNTENTLKFFSKNYTHLPLSIIKPSNLYGKVGVRIMKTEHKIYLGEVLSKKKHGKGIVVYKEGRIYEGHFYENQKNGFGCELYANGNLYIGEFSQNKKHGKGSFYWFNLCKAACIKDPETNIEQYHGLWWGGLPDGKGEHTKANGDYYKGNFKNGLKHGEGVQYFANGDEYKGEYVNGLPENYGHYIWRDGTEYKGDFKQGYRNGYGIWTDPKHLQKYQGHFLLDKKHGYGVFDWEGLNKQYRGNYVQDMRTGEGELYEKGKLVYKGLWENGKQIENYKSLQSFTPPKKTKQSLQQSRLMSNSQFRVKTAKTKIIPRSRNISATTTKKKQYQVNFVHTTQERSCRRGCVACTKRPKPGEYSQKYLTPQKSDYCR